MNCPTLFTDAIEQVRAILGFSFYMFLLKQNSPMIFSLCSVYFFKSEGTVRISHASRRQNTCYGPFQRFESAHQYQTHPIGANDIK